MNFKLTQKTDILKHVSKGVQLNLYSQILELKFQTIAACLWWGALHWNVYLPESMKIISFKAWNHIFHETSLILRSQRNCTAMLWTFLHFLAIELILILPFHSMNNDNITKELYCNVVKICRFSCYSTHFDFTISFNE